MIGVLTARGSALPSIKTAADLTRALGPQAIQAMQLLMALACVVLLYIGVRLALVFAATADAGKIAVLSTWRLTRGRFWLICFTLLVVQLPITLLAQLAPILVGGHAGPDGVLVLPPTEAFTAALLIALPVGLLAVPIVTGALAAIYRGVGRAP